MNRWRLSGKTPLNIHTKHDTATRIGAGRSGVRILAGAEVFLFSKSQMVSGVHLASCSMGTGILSRE